VSDIGRGSWRRCINCVELVDPDEQERDSDDEGDYADQREQSSRSTDVPIEALDHAQIVGSPGRYL